MEFPTLKGLIESILKSDKVDFQFSLVNINIVNKGTKPITIVNKDTVKVNPNLLSHSQKRAFFSEFEDSVQGSQFILDSSEKVGEKLVATVNENISFIDYFKDHIPNNYLDMLKVAILVKNEYDSGHIRSAQILKQQLAERYGIVANTICNLYSAGYFKEFLVPYFDEKVKDKNYTNEQFSNDFVRLMNDFPIAVFISNADSSEDVEKTIRIRVERNKRQGIKNFKVHGIGVQNVEKISETIQNMQNEKKIVSASIQTTERTIIAEVTF